MIYLYVLLGPGEYMRCKGGERRSFRLTGGSNGWAQTPSGLCPAGWPEVVWSPRSSKIGGPESRNKRREQTQLGLAPKRERKKEKKKVATPKRLAPVS